VAALTNAAAAARWALASGRDLTVLCSGEKGAFCLEDAVCAGFVVEALARDGARDLRPTDAPSPRGASPSPTRDASRELVETRRCALPCTGRTADFEVCLALSTRTSAA